MNMNADFMEKAVKFRQFYGPLVINSAYRCADHDLKVGTSATPGSGPHTMGRALDIKVPSDTAKAFMETVDKLGFFTGIGIDERQSIPDGEHFIHLDDLKKGEFPGHFRPGLWSYP